MSFFFLNNFNCIELDIFILLSSVGIFSWRIFEIKKKVKNLGELIIITFYKLISNYNSSPFQALFSLILVIFIFSLFYIPESTYSWETVIDYSFTNAIPFIEFSDKEITEKLMNNNITKYLSYFQKIISSGIILLFGLSLRRKFKR